LHLKDDEETHCDTWQLPNLIPIEQLNGTQAACSQTGFIEERRAFKVESAEPNDDPVIKMNELPVEGTLVPRATAVASNKFQVKALLKVEDCLEIETTAEEMVLVATTGTLQMADEELAQTDAWPELPPTRILPVCKKPVKPKPETVMLELPVLGAFRLEFVIILMAYNCSYEMSRTALDILEVSKSDET
jgi:hypothetical protein